MKWAELPAREDLHYSANGHGTTKWGNHDLYPIVPKERTYGVSAYFLYWLTCGAGLSTFALGSSYVSVGLTAGEACGAVLLGCTLTSLTAFLCGRPGAEKNLGYVSASLLSCHLAISTDIWIDYAGSQCVRTQGHVASSLFPNYGEHGLRKCLCTTQHNLPALILTSE